MAKKITPEQWGKILVRWCETRAKRNISAVQFAKENGIPVTAARNRCTVKLATAWIEQERMVDVKNIKNGDIKSVLELEKQLKANNAIQASSGGAPAGNDNALKDGNHARFVDMRLLKKHCLDDPDMDEHHNRLRLAYQCERYERLANEIESLQASVDTEHGGEMPPALESKINSKLELLDKVNDNIRTWLDRIDVHRLNRLKEGDIKASTGLRTAQTRALEGKNGGSTAISALLAELGG